jgi:RNA polymerase sigma-70 factor (ECF subfamily)
MDENRMIDSRASQPRKSVEASDQNAGNSEVGLTASGTVAMPRNRQRAGSDGATTAAHRPKGPTINGAKRKPPAAKNGNSFASAALAFLTQRCAAPPEPTDDMLVHAAQSGDERAFEILIERHQRPVYGYFRARVMEPADAEDMCQEVFLRCYQMPAVFESPIMVRPWLMGIARNVLREHIRKLTRRKEVAWTELCLDIDTSPDLNDAGEDLFDDIVGHLPGCIESLGGSAREALDMYYRSKMRLAQIGEKLRRSEGAVKLLMYRARQTLKNCLSRKCECPVAE